MAEIKVTSADLREKGKAFLDLVGRMQQDVSDMSGIVNALRSCWEGSDAEAYVAEFSTMNPRFEEIFEMIRKYASYLDMTAEEWDALEQQVGTAAAELN